MLLIKRELEAGSWKEGSLCFIHAGFEGNCPLMQVDPIDKVLFV